MSSILVSTLVVNASTVIVNASTVVVNASTLVVNASTVIVNASTFPERLRISRLLSRDSTASHSFCK